MRLVNTGHTEVVDADLSGYFDSIPHAELMQVGGPSASAIGTLLQLIKMWLEAPVEETDERGRTQRTTRNKDEGRGTSARRSDLAAVGQPVHASVRRWAGRRWGTSSVSMLTSSTMRMTS